MNFSALNNKHSLKNQGGGGGGGGGTRRVTAVFDISMRMSAAPNVV